MGPELRDIEINVPRTRCYSPVEVVRAYARCTPELGRVILSGFVLGQSIALTPTDYPGKSIH
jgi:hypothetical protein